MPDGPTNEPSEALPDGRTIHNKRRVVGDLSIPHVTDRFIPIHHIATALGRASFEELGILSSSLLDLADQKRKRKLVEYASRFRAEYIKVLILVNWARRAEEVSTAIDLRAWLQGQKNCFDNLYTHLRHEILRNLSFAITPAHDISGAIDVLRGNLESALHLDTADPCSRLTPAQILETLTNLNSLISLRLSLYEVIPFPMRNFTISSGRAIFTVADEFEVQLFFVSDEAQSAMLQWFLVDFSFCSGPTDLKTTPGSVKLEVEAVCNDLLVNARDSGKRQLVELYNFLHSFTVRYKMESLFNEFTTIGRRDPGRLDLRYSSARDILAIGFWHFRDSDTKALQNSLTISIESVNASARERALEHHKVTCEYSREQLLCRTRDGTTNNVIDIGSVLNCNATQIMERTLSGRISAKLFELCEGLLSNAAHWTRSRTSLVEGQYLTLEIPKVLRIEISIDHHQGSFVVGAATVDSMIHNNNLKILEASINAAHDVNLVVSIIQTFYHNFVRSHISRSASNSGWAECNLVVSAIDRVDFQRATGIASQSCLFLTRLLEGWRNLIGGPSWFLVIAVQPTGCIFWVLELSVDEARNQYSIQWLEQLKLDNQGSRLDLDPQLSSVMFSNLWRICTARIISLQLERALSDRAIEQYYIIAKHSNWEAITIPSICLKAASIGPPKLRWSEPNIIVEFGDICADATGGAFLSFGSRKLRGHQLDLGMTGNPGIAVNRSTNQFSINFFVFVAQPLDNVVTQFCNTWELIGRTVTMLESAKAVYPYMSFESCGLNYIRFTYAEGTAVIQLQQEYSHRGVAPVISTSLGSTTSKVNPHHRIAEYFSVLATRYQNNINVFLRSLMLTYPVMDVLSQMEQDNLVNPEFYIITRSITDYRIYYPNKRVALLIRATPAPSLDKIPEPYRGLGLENTIIWHFTDGTQSAKTPLKFHAKLVSCSNIFNEGLNDKLHNLGTFPEGTGIGCTEELASQVLREVHSTIMTSQKPYINDNAIGALSSTSIGEGTTTKAKQITQSRPAQRKK